MDRILNSGPFLHSRRRQRFLEYIVSETLAGRGKRLKGYNIALEVFHRPEDFDPPADPLVRIEAARLRDKLREYYGTEGQSDPILIDLPKGAYAPHIEFRQTGAKVEEVARPSRHSQRAFAALALLLALGAVGSWLYRERPSQEATANRSASSETRVPAIAVLPFTNL